jgi:deazaflavin-dependent oxidoreductase (nitroreductase family)
MPPLLRRFFWFLNKYFMVPIMRLGFGPLFGNPFTGYIMVLKAVGRKSGKIRFAPVNYAIHQGNVYCISGGRESSDWYRNVRATPEIEVILPGGAIFGRAEVVTEVDERRTVIRQILQNAGFAGFFEGYNPFTITDDELLQKSADLPVLRIRPLGIGSGASDPAGWAWIWTFVATILLVIWIVLK